ncbi:hypothetical protein N9A45_01030 [bacterium]|nr:hypothetical protein [bacterium]
MPGECIFVSLTVTLVCFGILWVDDLWANFYHWGPPFQVGSIMISSWRDWWIFVGLLVLYQASDVYIEETLGRKIERKHIKKEPFQDSELFTLACYNFYKWLGTILHILVAVTRVDVWLAIAVVDTFVRMCMWRSSSGNGRKPRVFST